MVIRVFAVLFCLLLCVSTWTVTQTMAGGPPACPPPSCYPAPCQSAPPVCGPPSPFGLCGGCLSICSTICGTVIGLPAAIMGGLLAPPPAFAPACRPPVCGPPMAPVPYCAPPMPPARIQKCKPVACQPSGPPAYCPPVGPQYGPLSYAVPRPCGPRAPTGCGCMALCGNLLEMPVRLISGVLSTGPLGSFCGAVASASDCSGSTFGTYW